MTPTYILVECFPVWKSVIMFVVTLAIGIFIGWEMKAEQKQSR